MPSTGDRVEDARTEIQATPIVVDGVLYTTTPALAVVALRADSGTLIWRFDPFAMWADPVPKPVVMAVQGIAFTRFTAADVVRHPLVARIIDAYDKHTQEEQ